MSSVKNETFPGDSQMTTLNRTNVEQFAEETGRRLNDAENCRTKYRPVKTQDAEVAYAAAELMEDLGGFRVDVRSDFKGNWWIRRARVAK
jgi:hypothetical protein